MPNRSSTRNAIAVALAALGLTIAACGSSSPPSGDTPGHGASPGMQMGSMGNGLAPTSQGYTLDSSISSLPPGAAQDYRFRILGVDRAPRGSRTRGTPQSSRAPRWRWW